MIPTSIDGTDITGATIDGTDVTEITVDGQTVFSAQTLPVAYSNLIAWYPFDSAEYGGSNADDVTAIIGASGDDTAYDGTVNGATYQSSAGVTDINAGASSGAFDFDGSNDTIGLPTINATNVNNNSTFMCWIEADAFKGEQIVLNVSTPSGRAALQVASNQSTIGISTFDGTSYGTGTPLSNLSTGTYHHIAGRINGDASNTDFFLDGQPASGSHSYSGVSQKYVIGADSVSTVENRQFDGTIDDVRIYNTDLTDSQIEDIYDNTV